MRKKNFHNKWPKRFYLYLLLFILCLIAPLLGGMAIPDLEPPLFTSYYGSLITLIAFPITINEIILLRNYQVKIAEVLSDNYRRIDTNVLIRRIEKLQGVIELLANEMNFGRTNGRKVKNLAKEANGEYQKVLTVLRGNEYITDVLGDGDDRTHELNECFIFVNKENEAGVNSSEERSKNVKNLLELEVALESILTKLKNSIRRIDG